MLASLRIFTLVYPMGTRIGKSLRIYELSGNGWDIGKSLRICEISTLRFYGYKLSLSHIAKILFISFFNLSTFLFWNKCWEVETHLFSFFRVWLDIYFLLIILHILFIDHLKTFIFELLLSLQIIYVAYTIYRIESYNMEGYGFAYLMLASLRIFTLVYPIGTRIW